MHRLATCYSIDEALGDPHPPSPKSKHSFADSAVDLSHDGAVPPIARASDYMASSPPSVRSAASFRSRPSTMSSRRPESPEAIGSYQSDAASTVSAPRSVSSAFSKNPQSSSVRTRNAIENLRVGDTVDLSALRVGRHTPCIVDDTPRGLSKMQQKRYYATLDSISEAPSLIPSNTGQPVTNVSCTSHDQTSQFDNHPPSAEASPGNHRRRDSVVKGVNQWLTRVVSPPPGSAASDTTMSKGQHRAKIVRKSLSRRPSSVLSAASWRREERQAPSFVVVRDRTERRLTVASPDPAFIDKQVQEAAKNFDGHASTTTTETLQSPQVTADASSPKPVATISTGDQASWGEEMPVDFPVLDDGSEVAKRWYREQGGENVNRSTDRDLASTSDRGNRPLPRDSLHSNASRLGRSLSSAARLLGHPVKSLRSRHSLRDPDSTMRLSFETGRSEVMSVAGRKRTPPTAWSVLLDRSPGTELSSGSIPENFMPESTPRRPLGIDPEYDIDPPVKHGSSVNETMCQRSVPSTWVKFRDRLRDKSTYGKLRKPRPFSRDSSSDDEDHQPHRWWKRATSEGLSDHFSVRSFRPLTKNFASKICSTLSKNEEKSSIASKASGSVRSMFSRCSRRQYRPPSINTFQSSQTAGSDGGDGAVGLNKTNPSRIKPYDRLSQMLKNRGPLRVVNS